MIRRCFHFIFYYAHRLNFICNFYIFINSYTCVYNSNYQLYMYLLLLYISFPDIFLKETKLQHLTTHYVEQGFIVTSNWYIYWENGRRRHWLTNQLLTGQPHGGCSRCPGYGGYDPTGEGRTEVDHTVAPPGVREGRTTRQLWTPYPVRGKILFCVVCVLDILQKLEFISSHFIDFISINFS